MKNLPTPQWLLVASFPLLLVLIHWQSCVDALTPLEAKSMSAKVVISSGVEFQSSIAGATAVPDVSSVLATLTSFPRESFHQKVQNLDVTGNPQPEAVTRDEFNNLQLYWTKPNTGICNFQLQANVETNSKILPIQQKIRFPIAEDILPPDIVNDYLQITEIANQNAEIQEIAHYVSNQVEDPSDLYQVVFQIADWVQTNIQYDKNAMKKNPSKKFNSVCKSATETLRTRVGKCDELSALFVSLNRALGIPSRFVTGYAYTNIPIGSTEDDPKNWGGHAWAEVYFPGIGWVPFDVAYGEYGYLSAGHVMLSTSDDAADNTNVHYHAQGFDFTITPRIIDISVTPDDITGKEDWGDWAKTSAQDVQVSLEAPQNSQQAGIGEVIQLLCTLKNPHDYYVCTRLDIANTQDTTLLDKISDHVLLTPQATKQIPLSFQVDPNLQKGYAYEFPFSVASGSQEARTTIMVKDQADARQKQIQGMKMQWENPARRPYYEGGPGGPAQPYGGPDMGRGSGSTGNTAGDWWGEGGGKSMFMSNQPRQPTPEDWKHAEQGYRPGQDAPNNINNNNWGGAGAGGQNSYNNPGYPANNNDPRAFQNDNRGYQDPYILQQQQQQQQGQNFYQPPNQWNPNQATNSYGPPRPNRRPATGPATPHQSDWHEKAGTTIYDNNNGWWNKEKREGNKVVRDYETKYVDKQQQQPQQQPQQQQPQEDTSWSMGPKGVVDDTRGRGGAGGQNSYGAAKGYGTPTAPSGQNNNIPYDGRPNVYNEGNARTERFQNPNRYDDSFFSKGQEAPNQQFGNNNNNNNINQGYSSYGGGQAADGWRGDGNAQKNFSKDWQRNDLMGRSREKYLQRQMGNQPPPPPGFGGGFDPYGPPPPPGMDPYRGGVQGDYYQDDRMLGGGGQYQYPPQPQDYNNRRDSTSSYYGNADSQTWWDDK